MISRLALGPDSIDALGRLWTNEAELDIAANELSRTLGPWSKASSSWHASGDDLPLSHRVLGAAVEGHVIDHQLAGCARLAPHQAERRVPNPVDVADDKIDRLVGECSDADALAETAAEPARAAGVTKEALFLEHHRARLSITSIGTFQQFTGIDTVCRPSRLASAPIPPLPK